MKQTGPVFMIVLFMLFSAGIAGAGSVLKDFKFRTIDGSTIEFNALEGAPMVVNVGTHW